MSRVLIVDILANEIQYKDTIPRYQVLHTTHKEVKLVKYMWLVVAVSL